MVDSRTIRTGVELGLLLFLAIGVASLIVLGYVRVYDPGPGTVVTPEVALLGMVPAIVGGTLLGAFAEHVESAALGGAVGLFLGFVLFFAGLTLASDLLWSNPLQPSWTEYLVENAQGVAIVATGTAVTGGFGVLAGWRLQRL